MILVRQRPMCGPQTSTAGSTPTVDLATLLFPISRWVSRSRHARNLSGIDIMTKALRFGVEVDHREETPRWTLRYVVYLLMYGVDT